MGLGEVAQPPRVDGPADHVHGRAVSPLRLHPDHPDDLDGHGGDANLGTPPVQHRADALDQPP